MRPDYDKIREVNELIHTQHRQIALMKLYSKTNFELIKTTDYKVAFRDNIQAIASKFKTTSKAIIDLNSLEYPYFSNAEITGVRTAFYGKVIKVPNNNQFANTLASPDVIYGCDFELSENYDLQIRDKELKTITGIDNVIQRIESLIRTTVGELLDAPGYGLPDAMGKSVSGPEFSMLLVLLKRNLAQDPAIAEVENVDVSFASGKTYIFYKVNLKNSNETVVGRVAR